MAIFSIENIAINGIAAAVPSKVESNWDYDYISEKERKLLIKTTGIVERRIAKKGQTTLDLCLLSANKLINELNWKRDEIGILIFVSQSADYHLPASSIVLQDKLNLAKNVIAFDINLGCSGYVYGLSVVMSLLKATGNKKALLLVGDISTNGLNYKDKSTYPLFGDGGSATALSINENNKTYFQLQSDGSGYDAIIIPDGGLRNPISDTTFIENELDSGIIRHSKNLHLNGLEVFNFTMREVAPQIKSILEHAGYEEENIDFLVFHQANKLLNETIRRKLKFPKEKVPYSLGKYGNTSSCSIPLTIVSELKDKLINNKKLILSGFGVGLSWGTAIVDFKDIVIPDLIIE